MGYNEDMAKYQADMSIYAAKIQSQAAINSAKAAAEAAIDAARIGARTQQQMLDLDKGRYESSYGSLMANDPSKNPANASQAEYYRNNPITRESLGFGGDAISEPDRQVQANRLIAGNSKQAASERLKNTSDLSSRGISYRSPLLDSLNSETDMRQADANALASATTKTGAAQANAAYKLAGQQAVETQVGGAAGTEKARQDALNGFSGLLQGLI